MYKSSSSTLKNLSNRINQLKAEENKISKVVESQKRDVYFGGTTGTEKKYTDVKYLLKNVSVQRDLTKASISILDRLAETFENIQDEGLNVHGVDVLREELKKTQDEIASNVSITAEERQFLNKNLMSIHEQMKSGFSSVDFVTSKFLNTIKNRLDPVRVLSRTPGILGVAGRYLVNRREAIGTARLLGVKKDLERVQETRRHLQASAATTPKTSKQEQKDNAQIIKAIHAVNSNVLSMRKDINALKRQQRRIERSTTFTPPRVAERSLSKKKTTLGETSIAANESVFEQLAAKEAATAVEKYAAPAIIGAGLAAATGLALTSAKAEGAEKVVQPTGIEKASEMTVKSEGGKYSTIDKHGVAFGKYQFNLTKGKLVEFLKYAGKGSDVAEHIKRTKNGYFFKSAKDKKAFKAKWLIWSKDANFNKAQDDFFKVYQSKGLEKVVSGIAEKTKGSPAAIRSVLTSDAMYPLTMSTINLSGEQGATGIYEKAVGNKPIGSLSQGELISNVSRERENFVKQHKQNKKYIERIQNEKAQTLLRAAHMPISNSNATNKKNATQASTVASVTLPIHDLVFLPGGESTIMMQNAVDGVYIQGSH